MSDKEVIKEMLTKAKIPNYEIEHKNLSSPLFDELPEGATSIYVMDHPGQDWIKYYNVEKQAPQPIQGGYQFDQEFVFDKDGNLIALWGWE